MCRLGSAGKDTLVNCVIVRNGNLETMDDFRMEVVSKFVSMLFISHTSERCIVSWNTLNLYLFKWCCNFFND